MNWTLVISIMAIVISIASMIAGWVKADNENIMNVVDASNRLVEDDTKEQKRIIDNNFKTLSDKVSHLEEVQKQLEFTTKGLTDWNHDGTLVDIQLSMNGLWGAAFGNYSQNSIYVFRQLDSDCVELEDMNHKTIKMWLTSIANIRKATDKKKIKEFLDVYNVNPDEVNQ